MISGHKNPVVVLEDLGMYLNQDAASQPERCASLLREPLPSSLLTASAMENFPQLTNGNRHPVVILKRLQLRPPSILKSKCLELKSASHSELKTAVVLVEKLNNNEQTSLHPERKAKPPVSPDLKLQHLHPAVVLQRLPLSPIQVRYFSRSERTKSPAKCRRLLNGENYGALKKVPLSISGARGSHPLRSIVKTMPDIIEECSKVARDSRTLKIPVVELLPIETDLSKMRSASP